MINVEIIKVHAGQILSCGRVTGNKEFTIGGLITVIIFDEMATTLQFSNYDWILIQ